MASGTPTAQAKHTTRPRLAAARALLACAVLLTLAGGWRVWVRLRQIDLDRAVIVAVELRDTASVPRLLERGADPNARQRLSGRDLSRWQEWLDVLLGRHTRRGAGASALALAVSEGLDATAVLLIERGAHDPGAPLLLRATEQHHERTAAALLAHGAHRLDDRDANGRPVIVLAARQRWWPIVLRMAAGGADTAAESRDDRDTALSVAYEQQGLALVQRLVASGARLQPTGKCDPTLRAAARAGDVAGVRWLLAAGAGVNDDELVYGVRYASWALRDAVESGSCQVTKLLLQAGARPQATDNFDGYPTPLMLAAESGREDLVRLLLHHGARVNACERFGTALCHAAGAGNLPMVRLLLHRGADVEGCDYHGNTALYDAIGRRDLRMARVLLSAGADVNKKAKWEWTPLMAAAREGEPRMVRLLLNNGAHLNDQTVDDRKTALITAAEDGHTAVVSLLLRRGADPNVVSEGNRDLSQPRSVTALMLASKPEIVRLLRRAGARE